DGHVDDALTDGSEFARLVALDERCSGIDLDVDAAVGAFAHQIGPDLGALAPGKRRADDNGQLVFALVGRGRSRSTQGKGRHGDEAGEKVAQFHDVSYRGVK